MKRNFYLQHQLMAMHDPRMQNLFDEEGPRGIGTYWIIIEKLSLLPDAKAQLKYLRSSTNKKLSITYIEKIIRNFQLFALEEDGSFSPEELNPLKKKEKKQQEVIEQMPLLIQKMTKIGKKPQRKKWKFRTKNKLTR